MELSKSRNRAAYAPTRATCTHTNYMQVTKLARPPTHLHGRAAADVVLAAQDGLGAHVVERADLALTRNGRGVCRQGGREVTKHGQVSTATTDRQSICSYGTGHAAACKTAASSPRASMPHRHELPWRCQSRSASAGPQPPARSGSGSIGWQICMLPVASAAQGSQSFAKCRHSTCRAMGQPRLQT